MAKIYGQESGYVKSIKDKNLLYVLIGVLILLAVVVFALTLYSSNHSLIFWLLTFGALLVVMKIIDIVTNKKLTVFLKAKSGLKGERVISQLLEKLPDTFNVYHGLKFPNCGDIDFTVIGPTGVFIIEVKSHSGKIDFNGQELTLNGRIFKEKNILQQAFGEAMTLHDYLIQKTGRDIFITPIIVFSSEKVFIHFGQNKINNVYVIQKNWLSGIINRQKNINQSVLLEIEKALAILLPI